MNIVRLPLGTLNGNCGPPSWCGSKLGLCRARDAVIAGIFTARLCIHLEDDGICLVGVVVDNLDTEESLGVGRESTINVLRRRLLDAVFADIAISCLVNMRK